MKELKLACFSTVGQGILLRGRTRFEKGRMNKSVLVVWVSADVQNRAGLLEWPNKLFGSGVLRFGCFMMD